MVTVDIVVILIVIIILIIVIIIIIIKCWRLSFIIGFIFTFPFLKNSVKLSNLAFLWTASHVAFRSNYIVPVPCISE